MKNEKETKFVRIPVRKKTYDLLLKKKKEMEYEYGTKLNWSTFFVFLIGEKEVKYGRKGIGSTFG
jgi:hypothetical protein